MSEAEFCLFCGAGVGKFRRDGEGTCSKCDPPKEKRMVELRLTIGLPASGKTTYAKQLVERGNYVQNPQHWVRVNWDDMRVARDTHLRNFNRKDEAEMQDASFTAARYELSRGVNVVVDNTNLNPKTRAKWLQLAREAGASYVEFPMETSLEECIRRDDKRTGRARCGRAVIERMALMAGLIKFPSWEEYIIVDLDGTIADCEARRKFISDGRHDWDNFEAHTLEDEPIQPIIDLVKLLAFTDEGDSYFRVLIVSGRHIDKTGLDSVKWLEKYGVPFKHIFMRQGGDNRPDNVVKQEILDKLPKSQIKYVFDDRNQVVDMWRANGLTCLQVAPGDF